MRKLPTYRAEFVCPMTASACSCPGRGAWSKVNECIDQVVSEMRADRALVFTRLNISETQLREAHALINLLKKDSA